MRKNERRKEGSRECHSEAELRVRCWLAALALTAVGDPGNFLAAQGGVGSRLGLLVLLLLSLRQKVRDLLLQLGADVVLGQNQNTQRGRVVLHHVQKDLAERQIKQNWSGS